MDEREAEYLRQSLRELEQANRRWKVVTFALLVLLTVLIIPGSLVMVGLFSTQRLRAERAAAEAEMARQQAEKAHQAALKAQQPPTKPAEDSVPQRKEGAQAQPARKP